MMSCLTSVNGHNVVLSQQHRKLFGCNPIMKMSFVSHKVRKSNLPSYNEGLVKTQVYAIYAANFHVCKNDNFQLNFSSSKI